MWRGVKRLKEQCKSWGLTNTLAESHRVVINERRKTMKDFLLEMFFWLLTISSFLGIVKIVTDFIKKKIEEYFG